MNYIGKYSNGMLTNKPQLISCDDLRYMYEENLRDAEACRAVTESSMRGKSYYGDVRTDKGADFRLSFFRDVLLQDPKISGFVMGYPGGLTVIRQGERGSYYRGERQIYPASIPSLARKLNVLKSEQDQRLYRLVADMRIAEFSLFLDRFQRTSCWTQNNLTVFYDALAQHYGLETDWLDITNDFACALFFATCCWDWKAKKWRPLTKEDTEQNENTQYGVLFHAPGWQINTVNAALLSNEDMNGAILPIGYQPFMRCSNQYGYAMYMRKCEPLQENIIFEKLHFRHSEKLSQDVFELMDQGRKIYPEEGLDDFADVIDMIASATSFSEQAFQMALAKNGWADEADALRKELETTDTVKGGAFIVRDAHPYPSLRQRLRQFNRKDVGFSIEKNYGIQLTTRQVFLPDT